MHGHVVVTRKHAVVRRHVPKWLVVEEVARRRLALVQYAVTGERKGRGGGGGCIVLGRLSHVGCICS